MPEDELERPKREDEKPEVGNEDRSDVEILRTLLQRLLKRHAERTG